MPWYLCDPGSHSKDRQQSMLLKTGVFFSWREGECISGLKMHFSQSQTVFVKHCTEESIQLKTCAPTLFIPLVSLFSLWLAGQHNPIKLAMKYLILHFPGKWKRIVLGTFNVLHCTLSIVEKPPTQSIIQVQSRCGSCHENRDGLCRIYEGINLKSYPSCVTC